MASEMTGTRLAAKDAVTIVGMLELNRWMLGLSYDITVSSLTAANNSRGAFELSHCKDMLAVPHPQQAAGWVVGCDGDHQLLRGTGLPDKVALEIGQNHRS